MIRSEESCSMRSHKPFALIIKANEALGDSTCDYDTYATNSDVALVACDDTKVHNILEAKD